MRIAPPACSSCAGLSAWALGAGAEVTGTASKVNCWAQIPTLVHSPDFLPPGLSFSVCKMEMIPPASKALCKDHLKHLVPGRC